MAENLLLVTKKLAQDFCLILWFNNLKRRPLPSVVQPDVNIIWLNCLQIIKDHVNQQSFKTWFEPIKPIKLENSVLTIEVPSQFFYEWLEEHYVGLLSKTIRQELGNEARLEYRIVIENSSKSAAPFTVNMPAQKSEPSYMKKTPTEKAAKEDEAIKNPFVIPGLKKLNIDSQLNPSYTFDTYVEGECNQLARSAGLAVANNPGGTAFNPLVLYGGVGLGKTHLAQAIGNFAKANYANITILYVSSEKFTNQFIDAVKGGSINDFINFYQLVDILIVDDVQFFADKDRTQDIFFHIFNHLHQSGKQIILTSDRPPKDMHGMEERLISRFKWGLTTDLQVPDYETRVAILEKKMYAEGIELPREVVDYIAYAVNTNIRELEGALITILAQGSLMKQEIDLGLVKRILKSFINNTSKNISIGVIQQKVCEECSVSQEQLIGKSRKREIVQARQIAMYFAKQFTNASLKAIGREFGGRDHSTVIHACQTISNLMDTDMDFQQHVLSIEKQLKMNL